MKAQKDTLRKAEVFDAFWLNLQQIAYCSKHFFVVLVKF